MNSALVHAPPAFYSVPSDTYNKKLTPTINPTEYYIEFRPRNFFHDNQGDCGPNMPYTTKGKASEDIYVKEDVQLINDYVKITWNFIHEGNDTHQPDHSQYYRHELPTLYVNPNLPDCLHLNYEDPSKKGTIQDKKFPSCDNKTGSTLNFNNNWYSIWDPVGAKLKLTIVGNTNVVDTSQTQGQIEGTFRNYNDDCIDTVTKLCPRNNAMQLDYSYYFNITPSIQFTTTTYVIPHLYQETMKDGTRVSDFISYIQNHNGNYSINLLQPVMWSGAIIVPNLLTGNMLKTNTIAAKNQNVQWFGS